MRNLNMLLFALILSIWTGCSPQDDLRENENQLPNIIWLVAEDQSPEFYSMYGNPIAETPYLDSLALHGVVYENAYAPVPVCAPARSAIITGMYPTTLGTHNMRTFNAYNNDNQPDINISSYSPIVPSQVRMFTEYLRAAGYYCTNNAKEDYNFRTLPSAWDESGREATWRNRPEGAPFFAIFNFGITHESQVWAQGDQPLLVSPEEVSIPPIFPDNDTIRKDLAVNYSNIIRMDQQIGVIIEQLKEDDLYEDSYIFFYGDHGGPFPRYKRALYETGLKVPFIVKLPGKSGASTRSDRLVSFIDLAPTLLSIAGIPIPEYIQGKAFLGDQTPEEAPEFVFATSDRFDGQVDRLRAVRYDNFKYIRNYNRRISNALPVVYREQMPMMRNLMQLYQEGQLEESVARWFKTPKPAEELYDIEKDPYELNNLAGDRAYRDTLEFFRKVVDDWIIETKDLGEIDERELMESWLNDGQQPVLEPLIVELKGDGLHFMHAVEDATIIWKHPEETAWRIYTQPLSNKEPIEAKAVRIGFEDSPIYIN